MSVAKFDAHSVVAIQRPVGNLPSEFSIPGRIAVWDFNDWVVSCGAAVVYDGVGRTDHGECHSILHIGASVVVYAVSEVDGVACVEFSGRSDAEVVDYAAGVPVNPGAHLNDVFAGIGADDHRFINEITE